MSETAKGNLNNSPVHSQYKDQSHKYYFDNPEVWEQLRAHGLSRELAFLRRIFEEQGSIRRILDVGSGTGLHCEVTRPH